MPLTNPNKVITEERLSSFYQDILPYLGGMPEILANKFSRGDIYSTEEKMIGQWTDGKPIYQKSWTGLTIMKDENTVASFSSAIIDTLIDGCITTTSYNNSTRKEVAPSESFSIRTYNNKDIKVESASTYSFTGCTLTILYTKTTDSAISIGVDTDYSTTEKIVGTWIDGRPVWQNTVSTGGSVPTGATLILRTAMASTGYDTILYTKTS